MVPPQGWVTLHAARDETGFAQKGAEFISSKKVCHAKYILGEGTETVHSNRHKIPLSATVLKPQNNYL